MTQESLHILDVWASCRRLGVLPAAGGFLDQPACLMDCLELVDGFVQQLLPAPGHSEGAA